MPELGQRVTSPGDETTEQQAYITRLLLDYVHAPIVPGVFLRGVLPMPHAVRIVTGISGAVDTGGRTAYEIPLADDGDPVTAPLVLGWTRTLAAGPPAKAGTTVMGMPLVRVDTDAVEVAGPTEGDRALRVLRTLAWPFVETPPDPPLCGFLFTGDGRLRLYVAVEEAGGLVAADVRLTGAVTALLAALPSLVREDGRWKPDPADPHCLHTVDLTDW
jgi:hypothetical protein